MINQPMAEEEEGAEIEEDGLDDPHTLKTTQKMKMNISLLNNQRLLALIARNWGTTQMNAKFHRRTSQRKIKRK